MFRFSGFVGQFTVSLSLGPEAFIGKERVMGRLYGEGEGDREMRNRQCKVKRVVFYTSNVYRAMPLSPRASIFMSLRRLLLVVFTSYTVFFVLVFA